MGRQGNNILIIILVLAVGFALFLLVPLGGRVGEFREAMISFIFRKPPQFISVDVSVNGVPRTIKAGEALKITGKETIVITKIRANTFFESYLTADVEGFGKTDDLHEPIETEQIRKQLMDAGIRSVPIEISYIDRAIAKVPLQIDLSRGDYWTRFREAGDIDAKIAVLKSAHVSFPNEKRFVAALDGLLSGKNDYQSLAGIYRGMAEADPEDTASLWELSRCYIKLGMFREALDTCLRIVDSGRANSATFSRMALIAGETGDFENRVKYLRKALELDPGSDAIAVNLGKTYEQAGQGEKAMEVYRKAASGAKDREILIPVIAEALKSKNYQEAAPLLKRYVSLYPQDKNAFAQLAMVMGKLGETGAQTSYYQKAVGLNPKDPVLLYNLAVSQEKAGNSQAALGTYRKVLEIKPGDHDSLVRAAALSMKAGDYRASYDYYLALSHQSRSTEFRKGLVSAAVGMKDTDRIIEASREYLKTAKDHDAAITLAYAYETRARAKQGKGRLDDLTAALDAYRLALRINPGSPKAQEKIPELKIETIKLKRGA